ncbi:MAG TPA: tyrosine-protein phosphatase [Methanocorpusculum sp.]|nr:tyrosine-protein phosphatase [Methanocorpusculum sp.]
MNRLAFVCIAAVLCIAVAVSAGCIGTPQNADNFATSVPVSTYLYVNEKFSTIGLNMTASEFDRSGILPGDSVDIVFSNGVVCNDVPYLTGVFVRNGQLILLNRSATMNTLELVRVNAGNEWDALGVTPNETVTVTLAEKQKYALAQKLNKLRYSRDRTKFASDEEFTNFRAVSGGNLKPDYIYRGASAIDNLGRRVSIVNKLLESHGVQTLIDMADTDAAIEKMQAKEGHDAPYFDRLYQEGDVVALGMSTAFASDAFKQKIVQGFREILNRDGPFYIFCLEGKNRTGVAALLLEALAGATYDEMVADYMQTYTNYYKITKDKNPDMYRQIVELKFDEAVKAFSNGSPSADLKNDARSYLLSGGMTDEEIDALIAKICN